MTSRARIPALLGAALLAVALTGCSPGADEPEPAPTVTQTVTETVAPEPSPTSVAVAGSGGIADVVLGMPFDEAVAQTGAAPQERCEWVATAQDDGYTMTIQRAEPAIADPPPVELVSVSAPPGGADGAGPRTAEGIGLGSTVEEVLATYPDAEEMESLGDRRYLRVTTGAGNQGLFLTYSADVPVVWQITATSLDVPPYESCA